MFDEHAKSMETCSACPSLCQSACPVHRETGNKSFAPWGMMQMLNRVRKKETPFTPEIADVSYQCTTCRACVAQCEFEIPIPTILEGVRMRAVKDSKAPPEIQGFLEKFHRHNNPFSKDLLQKLKTLVPASLLEKETPVVYYATCTSITKCPEIVQDTFALFKKLKIDFVSVYTDPIQCCGYPLYSAGAHYDFVDLAEINYHALKKYKLIITGSPACAWTLRQIYAKYDFDIASKVVTINEFLKPYLKNINFKTKRNIKTKLMYHDPCYLSRYLNEADLPREMIAGVSGYAPVEFHDNHHHSQCSGQGGCYSIVNKDSADAITKSRLSEAYEKKIKTIVTQCPTCIFKMRQNSQGLIVRDVISYLNESIQGSQDE